MKSSRNEPGIVYSRDNPRLLVPLLPNPQGIRHRHFLNTDEDLKRMYDLGKFLGAHNAAVYLHGPRVERWIADGLACYGDVDLVAITTEKNKSKLVNMYQEAPLLRSSSWPSPTYATSGEYIDFEVHGLTLGNYGYLVNPTGSDPRRFGQLQGLDLKLNPLPTHEETSKRQQPSPFSLCILSDSEFQRGYIIRQKTK